MPARKPQPKPDANTAIVRAVERVTGSERVKGEDLLPPRLAKQLREAKRKDSETRNKKRNFVAPANSTHGIAFLNQFFNNVCAKESCAAGY